MDDVRPSPEGPPLRLVLQPDGMAVQLTEPEVVLGRHSSADVRLPLPDVSRHHCRFVCRNGTWQVFDLNSLNGLFVNGERVQQAVLKPGDIVGVGGFCLKVELGGTAPPAPAGPALAEASLRHGLTPTLLRVGHDLGRPRKAS